MTEPRLTSAEMANLWNVYVNNTMSECILKYISNQAEDREVLSIVEYALQAARNNLRESAILLKKEGMPIPRGFTDEDVNIHADRLFTDHFFLAYLQQMCKAGFIAYGLSLSMSARADIRAYFLECLRLNTELFQKVSDVLLQKGLFSHAPFIPTPHHIDFVQDQGFLTGWFGKRKPLLAVEIAYLHHNIMTNAVGKALITGFAQVCANPDIRAFFLRGKRLANKQMEVFSSLYKVKISSKCSLIL